MINPQMLPPDRWDRSEPAEPFEYDVPRGTCPRCGTDRVVHLVIGMPAHSDDYGSGPDWVSWVGCVHPGFDRSCAECGLTWDSGLDDDGEDDR
jgi:hypothetical protein